MRALVGPDKSTLARDNVVRDNVARILLLVGTCFFLFLSFEIGILRGTHDVVGAQSWGRVLFAVGGAITEMAHGGYGYTIAKNVEAILTANGLTGHLPTLAQIGIIFPENLRNPYLMDSAIAKAVQFQWAFDPNQGVRGSGGDDVGFFDFVKISFHLFGYRILSLYLTFFVIQGLTAIAFICAFRDRVGLLATLLVLTGTEAAVFSSSLLSHDYIGTLADPRVLSILSLIPALHMACLTTERASPTPANLFLAMFQCSILVLTLWVRASAFWVLLALTVLAVVVAAIGLRSGRSIYRFSRLWGIAVLFVLFAVHQTYVSMTLHPVYKENHEIRHHVLWQSMFYALAVHPDWPAKYAGAFDHATGDILPVVAAKKYLLRNPPPDPDSVYLTADQEYLKVGATETYARRAFIEFFTQHPAHVIETFVVYNPMILYHALVKVASSLASMSACLKAVFFVAGLGLTALLSFRGNDLAVFARTALLVMGAFAFSLVPIVLTAPSELVIADQIFLLLMTGSSWIMVVISFVVRVFAIRFSGHPPATIHLPRSGKVSITSSRDLLAEAGMNCPNSSLKRAEISQPVSAIRVSTGP